VCDALNAFDIIEIAYPLGTVGDPVIAAPVAAPPTPDFENLQGYRRAAPTGVDADYGNTFSAGFGVGTVIADVETGWTDDHEDIRHASEDQYVGLGGAPYPWDHGTAVLGELVGENQGFGVKGLAYGAEVRLSSHTGDSGQIGTAIMHAINAVSPGDFVVLEMQCFGGPPAPFPCEYVDSTFALVQAATANGIHVVAASGNGNNDLDSGSYGGKFDRSIRDSGAIMVGASNGSSLDKASFSNYGSRLDAHGWGFDVTSAGYGDLFADGSPSWLREYTAQFSGTSSATPIVTGAAVLANSIYREAFGVPIDPLVLRAAITATGTPQGSGGYIGPRPDLRDLLPYLGVPRIAVSGTFVPGSSFDVDIAGPADAVYIVFFSAGLRTPFAIPPYGDLLLANPIQRRGVGHLDVNGEATYTGSVPPNAIPGTTYGYFQAWQRYGGPGVGAFTNYVRIDVQ
jgi:subtilisin family serine protease